MDIDKTKCVGCGNCHAICPMGAISLDVDGKSGEDCSAAMNSIEGLGIRVLHPLSSVKLKKSAASFAFVPRFCSKFLV